MTNIFRDAHKGIINITYRHYRTNVLMSFQGTSCPEKTLGYGVCVQQDPKSESIALFDIERKKWDAVRISSIVSYEVL